MSVVLGVEGGGSHSHAVVATTSGEVLGAGISRDPANWEDVGIEAAGAALKSCARSALNEAGVAPHDIATSVFALAGVDFPVDEQRLGGIPEALRLGGRVEIMNDAFASFRAGSNRPFGVVVVAGTGSIVAGTNPDGEHVRTLGLGPMLGDSGSASEISEAGVTAVAEAFTERGAETALTGLLCEAAGAPTVVDFLERAGRARIDTATFAPLVVQAAEAGDPVAQGILARAGKTLGATAGHVIRRLRMEELEFDLVMAGGVIRSDSPYLLEPLEASVRSVAPLAAPVRLDTPAVVGSVLLAMDIIEGATRSGLRTALAERIVSKLGFLG
jgi:N-acetylglucosamine kinase-like BadF-type ATPase